MKNRPKEKVVGRVFNRLTVINEVDKKNKNKRRFLVRCECGNETYANLCDLKAGKTKSCGCLSLENIRNLKGSHFLHDTKIYAVWKSMRDRCNNKNSKAYHRYGGRGIFVCEEWGNFINFYEWSVNNGHKDGLCIDRINNDGNYEPSNCRWVTVKVNNRNKSDNRFITCNGDKKTLAEWAEILNVTPATISARIDVYGFTEKEAILRPFRKRGVRRVNNYSVSLLS